MTAPAPWTVVVRGCPPGKGWVSLIDWIDADTIWECWEFLDVYGHAPGSTDRVSGARITDVEWQHRGRTVAAPPRLVGVPA